MNAPAGTLFARALITACTSAIEAAAFERRVIPGPDAEQDDVVVVVDEAGHDGAAAQVDLARAGAEALIAARADGRESAVLNRDLGRRGSLRDPS